MCWREIHNTTLFWENWSHIRWFGIQCRTKSHYLPSFSRNHTFKQHKIWYQWICYWNFQGKNPHWICRKIIKHLSRWLGKIATIQFNWCERWNHNVRKNLILDISRYFKYKTIFFELRSPSSNLANEAWLGIVNFATMLLHKSLI